MSFYATNAKFRSAGQCSEATRSQKSNQAAVMHQLHAHIATYGSIKVEKRIVRLSLFFPPNCFPSSQ